MPRRYVALPPSHPPSAAAGAATTVVPSAAAGATAAAPPPEQHPPSMTGTAPPSGAAAPHAPAAPQPAGAGQQHQQQYGLLGSSSPVLTMPAVAAVQAAPGPLAYTAAATASYRGVVAPLLDQLTPHTAAAGTPASAAAAAATAAAAAAAACAQQEHPHPRPGSLGAGAASTLLATASMSEPDEQELEQELGQRQGEGAAAGAPASLSAGASFGSTQADARSDAAGAQTFAPPSAVAMAPGSAGGVQAAGALEGVILAALGGDYSQLVNRVSVTLVTVVRKTIRYSATYCVSPLVLELSTAHWLTPKCAAAHALQPKYLDPWECSHVLTP